MDRCEGPGCANPITPAAGPGRDRRFCSSTCRGKASRYRRRDEQAMVLAAEAAERLREGRPASSVVALASLGPAVLEQLLDALD